MERTSPLVMEQPEQNETPTHIPPRIYVASLSDYNAGRLHGVWIDADQDPDDINTTIQRMLAASPDPYAEEWAIHDHEGFSGLRLSEYTDLETVTRIAGGIEEHGDGFTGWLDVAGDTDEDTCERFGEAYLGRWESMTAFAEQFAEDLGLTIDLVPEWARPYVTVDIDALARDLDIELATAPAEEGGIHVYQPNA